MISDRLLDDPKEMRQQLNDGIATGPVGPARRPGIAALAASVLLQLVATWLMVTVWFAPDAVVGFGSVAAGEFLKQPKIRVGIVVAASLLWVAHFVEAWFSFTVASSVPQLRPFRWQWSMMTLAVGYPSLRLLIADANRAQQAARVHGKMTHWGIVSSMMVKPSPAHFGVHDHGIMPGTLRYRLEHFVEGTSIQLVILFLVLVDIVVVAFELVVTASIVEWADGIPGHEIEEALHWTSVVILSLFLFELFILIFVYRRAFFVGPGSFWLKVDLLVVSLSLFLELVLHHGVHGDGDHDEDAEYSELAGLLILVRMPWRLVRVAPAIVGPLEKVQKSDKHGQAVGHKASAGDALDNVALIEENKQLKAQLLELGVQPQVSKSLAPLDLGDADSSETVEAVVADRARRGSTQ